MIEANICAASADAAVGEVMNIAGGSRVTMHHVTQLLQEISGSPISATFEEKQHGDVRHTFADTKLAERLVGYHPLVSLREGLEKEFEYIASLYRHGLAAVS